MSDGSDTLVFFALKEEQKPFLRLLPAASRATVRLCGMGRENARRATLSALQELSPRRILTCGFCGGLNPEFESGAVCFESPSERLSQALSATGLRPARFLFHDRIAVTREEKRLLRQSTQADLVEMESGIIH